MQNSWAYLPVINVMIQVLLTVAGGGLMGALGVFKADEFVPIAVRFVFYVALPCLVIKGIGIGVDFYSEKNLWVYISAFLILRAISLAISVGAIFFSNWTKRRPSKGLGDVAVLWISLTWISTVIMGVPISTAVFGNSSLGVKYGVLAGISSFIFQLPLQLLFLECHALKESMKRTSIETIEDSMANDIVEWGGESTEESVLESGVQACKAVQVSPGSSSKDEPTEESKKCDALPDDVNTEAKWWSLSGVDFVWNGDLWLKVAIRVLRNPVLWGIFWGFVLSLSTAGKYLRCPTGPDCIEGLAWINLTLSWFGACVSPVSLFAMGLWVNGYGFERLFRISIARLSLFMVSKLIIVPLIMVGLAKGLNFTDEAGRAAVLISTLPISLASFSLGHQYKIGEIDLAANVAAGTILMLPTVLVWNLAMDKVGLFPLAA